MKRLPPHIQRILDRKRAAQRQMGRNISNLPPAENDTDDPFGLPPIRSDKDKDDD